MISGWAGRLLVLAVWLLAWVAPAPANRAASASLLGWNNLGMHCMDADFSVFSILPPYNTLEAQLIVGGKLVRSGSGYSVTYEAVADPDGSINTTSLRKGNFYDFTASLYGPLEADQGLAGWGMPGPLNQPQSMRFEALNEPVPGVFTPVNWFRAEGIPITPYDDQGNKNPYPLMRLVARNQTGQVLATCDVVLPVSDEMDCTLCHGPRESYRENILQLHDTREFARNGAAYGQALEAMHYLRDGLLPTAQQGQPVLCAQCHASEALGTKSYGTIPPLTTSMHAMHATVTDPITSQPLGSVENRSACYRCHPGSDTRCLRGAMGAAVASDGTMSMQCQSCHGGMAQVGSPDRVGWLMEPNCQSCHTGTATRNNGQIRYTSVFEPDGRERVPADPTFATTPNTPAAGISLYRFSTGHGGLQCSACHGSTHAEFPSSHRNDNIRNEQLQGHAGVTAECTACHTTMPSTVNGGPHGMHPLGQDFVDRHHDSIQQVGLAACQACHGADSRGTVLSRVQGARTFRIGDAGTVRFYRGATVGCYTCHDGPATSHMNTSPAPGITDVSGRTTVGVPVEMVLPVGNASAVLRVLTQPANGTVGLNHNIATYFPFPGFVGTDTLTFASYDGAKNSALATGTVTSLPARLVVLSPGPSITGFSPSSGGVGTAVTIKGKNLGGALAVTFNGRAASFTVIDSETVVAGVPKKATSGPLRVTTPDGVATSASSFLVTGKSVVPVINSWSPNRGPVGTEVTLKGANLGAVMFARVGSLTASYAVRAAGEVAVVIPSGASSGRITLTTPGGSVSSGTFRVDSTTLRFAERD